MNQVRYDDDERLGDSMASVCRRHLGIEIDCIGSVRYDDGVWQANRKKRPFMLDFPRSRAGRALAQITRDLMVFRTKGEAGAFEGTESVMFQRLSERDYYQVLEVGYDATSDEIRAAYEEAKKLYSHDSLVSGSILEEDERRRAFECISDAYQTLVAEESRRLYDAFTRSKRGLRGPRDSLRRFRTGDDAIRSHHDLPGYSGRAIV